MEHAFEAAGVVKRFGKTPALAGMDLSARPGTILGVLGPNGAGKTTAIRVLATLLTPDAGRVAVGGHDALKNPAAVRERIGLTGQYATVDEDLTGAENLHMLGRLLGFPRAHARARASQLLEQFGLQEAATRPVSTYSGGMRRRLDLAAGLIGRPQIVFLDEPTTGLDPGRREDMWRSIRELCTEGTTVLLTTQYLEEADALADEISVIDAGRVIAHDTPAGLKRRVGGRTAVVRPHDPRRHHDVREILARVTGRAVLGDASPEASVAIDAERDFHRIIRELDSASIAVDEIALRLPSLDEAFAHLTTPREGERRRSDPAGEERAA